MTKTYTIDNQINTIS